MINKFLNLICKDGHKHYSPTPENWIGKACYFPIGDKSRCSAPMEAFNGRR